MFLLKQLVLDTYSKNNLQWVLFITKMLSEHCMLVTLLKELHHRTFPDKFSNFCNQLFFATFSFMKKQITWKITWQLSKEKGQGKERDDSSAFLRWVFLNIKHLLKNKPQKQNNTPSILNPYLQKDHVRPNWKDILVVVEVLP